MYVSCIKIEWCERKVFVIAGGLIQFILPIVLKVLYYIDAEDSSYAFYEDDLSNDQEQDDTLDKVPMTGSGPTSGTACCIPF
ncbi:hypothetical protein E2562_006698 [Oryza meyeriana var. granulata]|uniref:Uncharacterized protein n=1 Tax=Oryza meyeriana var. granulata TaxID=110450 RepID=A0A6G1EFY8_9ORYZ|nr:hypothetical protein E2562_006698 [Oryza meyeriana var. granulata]